MEEQFRFPPSEYLYSKCYASQRVRKLCCDLVNCALSAHYALRPSFAHLPLEDWGSPKLWKSSAFTCLVPCLLYGMEKARGTDLPATVMDASGNGHLSSPQKTIGRTLPFLSKETGDIYL